MRLCRAVACRASSAVHGQEGSCTGAAGSCHLQLQAASCTLGSSHIRTNPACVYTRHRAVAPGMLGMDTDACCAWVVWQQKASSRTADVHRGSLGLIKPPSR
jgi:hypothetical protein